MAFISEFLAVLTSGFFLYILEKDSRNFYLLAGAIAIVVSVTAPTLTDYIEQNPLWDVGFVGAPSYFPLCFGGCALGYIVKHRLSKARQR